MNKRTIIILLILFICVAGVWFARRQTPAALPQPVQPVSVPQPMVSVSVPPVVTKSVTTVPVTVLPKQAPPPMAPKKIPKPKKVDLPKPAAVSVAVPVAPIIPAPTLQPRQTLPVVPITPVPEAAPQEWKGNSDTSITHAGQIVVQSDEQWIHFWAEHHPDEAAPEVDFSRSMVIGVFLGLRPSDGFLVSITGIRTLADKLVVDYIQLDPPVGTFQIGVSAYPYDIKVIPRSKLRVTFNQLTPQYQRAAPPAAAKK